MKPPYAIGSVPSLSGHVVAYRWCSLPRVRRHRANKPQGSSERVLPWQITMDQLIFASLSHTHYWYEVGMLKVPAVNSRWTLSPYHPACVTVTINKDLFISPRYTPYEFLSRCKFGTLTTRQPMVEFYLLMFSRFPLRKKEYKSWLNKNRTHDFRPGKCAD